MASRYWPLFDLRLEIGPLELRPLCEADLNHLAALWPTDEGLDPELPSYEIEDPGIGNGIALHQFYWRSYGTWNTSAWRLNFAVRRAGELIGTQELEGNDFLQLRTVDSSSLLVPDARGRGLGKQMRRAVLALAFGPMEARAAITSAWHDNYASLGVSRALGYVPNGEMLHRRGDTADVMVHKRLTRAAWLAAGGGEAVTIDGFEPCRPLFGLGKAAL